MESHPGKISPEPVKTIKIMRKESEKRTLKPAVCDHLDINLRGNQEKNAKNERDEQAFASFSKILTCIPEVQRKSCALPRKDKKNGHDPLNQDAHKHCKT